MLQLYKLLLQVTLFYLLTENKVILATSSDKKEHGSNENVTQISRIAKIGGIKKFLDRNVQFTYDDIQLENNILETNSIYGFTDKTKLKYSSGFHDYLAEEQSQLGTLLLQATLKKVQKRINMDRKKKTEELNRRLSTLDSPFEGCSKDPYPALESRTIKKFEVNLDAPPEDRWREVVRQNKVQMKMLTDYFESLLGPEVMNGVDIVISWLHRSLPKEYYQELSGIALEAGINVGRVTLYNVFYEFFSLCTSIVLEGKDGKMYHGRNLDFGAFMGWNTKNHTWYVTEILRPLTIKVDFIKNGELLYSAVTYAGYTGALTAVKKNKFSLTVNMRFKKDGGYVGLAEWIIGLHDASWIGLVTRQVMESAGSYNEATQLLANKPLIAPAYFILAGNSSHQGCIVTRGRRNFDIWELGRRHKEQKSMWYILETNYDHWEETSFYDHRRQYAVQCMEEIGRQKPLETLYQVLSTKPVLNKETTLTAVMDVREGLLQVWERFCPDPCWPF